ncbi:bifunctional adenosylcobinamide kinase/adenosylcobinamide-phosphate guanylyltransferase [Gordonia zhaorongruii]|uniref:bifunctional adenosylcobinamide kinase/adenosylcobinamide-phosphate guanylyltransferase n=1 Tax=Gordonia zhaorongruii TaxID=2597659 RepID=UPI00104E6A46|nr:bifunctional adenosylcobinamide kinase/adenosylcobinamide-phosphate guanylyltransferase [Gordonia zhaorongruii]
MTTEQSTEFVIGAARSGKSRYAAAQAAHLDDVTVIATALAGDDEMAERIARHRAARPVDWQTVEEPHDLVGALRRQAAPERFVIVDCLTMWLANLHGSGPDTATVSAELVRALPGLPGRILLVSNEIGAGLVQTDAASRRFVDDLGRLNQSVAAACERVTLMTAGIPLMLKDASTGERGSTS